MYGWRGKILTVNLTDQTTKEAPLDEAMAHDYVGGRGLGARLLWDMVGPTWIRWARTTCSSSPTAR